MRSKPAARQRRARKSSTGGDSVFAEEEVNSLFCDVCGYDEFFGGRSDGLLEERPDVLHAAEVAGAAGPLEGLPE